MTWFKRGLDDQTLEAILQQVYSKQSEPEISPEEIEDFFESGSKEPLSEGFENRLVEALLQQRKRDTLDVARQQVAPKNMTLGRFLERVRAKAKLTQRVCARFLRVDEALYTRIENGLVRVYSLDVSLLACIARNLIVDFSDFCDLLRHSLALEKGTSGEISAIARSDPRNPDSGAVSSAIEDLLRFDADRRGDGLPVLDKDFVERLRREIHQQTQPS